MDMILTSNAVPTGPYDSEGNATGTIPTHNVGRCYGCDTIFYSQGWPECPKGCNAGTSSGVTAGFIYHNVARLRFIRGEVRFKRDSYMGPDYDLHPDDWAEDNAEYVTFMCHCTGPNDRAKPWRTSAYGPWKNLVRHFHKPGSKTGGDPTLIAAHLRFIRSTI